MAGLTKNGKEKLTAPAHYIQTTDAVSRPLAVMWSLFILFAVLVVFVGIFFGGRWTYNQITGKNDQPSSITKVVTGESLANSTSGTATVTETTTGSASVTSGSSSSVAVDKPAASEPASTASSPPASAANGASGQSQNGSATPVVATVVPNTGAGGMLGVFVLSAIMGTLGYRAVLIRKLSH